VARGALERGADGEVVVTVPVEVAGVTADCSPGSERPAYVPVRAAGLRVTATEEYRRLEAELPGLP
jgi:hypothetical protein